jgi:uncharacterized protein YggT (Ycf19 family)
VSAADFILNLVGLLLWLRWRSLTLASRQTTNSAPAGAATTSTTADAWGCLVGLAGLLVLRAWFYRQLGTSIDWVPKLDLGLIVLPFRSDRFHPILLFSALSFARVWILFYFWLAVLALCQNREHEPQPILKWVRLHLGWVGRKHWSIQATVLLGLVALGWLSAYPLLAHLDIVGPASSPLALAGQCLLVAFSLLFSLKLLLPVLLLVYFLTSYVYLGKSPWWDFVGASARVLLIPLKRLPLRAGRLDLAPLVAVILLLLLLQVLPDLVLRRLSRAQITVWPR